MKKPAFIRFFGWAFWFLGALGIGLVIADGYMQAQGHISALGILCWVFSGPCLVVWVIGSLVHAVSKSHAKQQAETLAQLMNAAKQGAGLCGFPGPGGVACDLPAGHQGAHRGTSAGPRAVTSPLGLTGTEPRIR
jgi:hypothetical protein